MLHRLPRHENRQVHAVDVRQPDRVGYVRQQHDRLEAGHLRERQPLVRIVVHVVEAQGLELVGGGGGCVIFFFIPLLLLRLSLARQIVHVLRQVQPHAQPPRDGVLPVVAKQQDLPVVVVGGTCTDVQAQERNVGEARDSAASLVHCLLER